MGNEAQTRKTTIPKECPLVADMGTPATVVTKYSN